MTSDHDVTWVRRALLGRVLLPLVDQEPWRPVRRREHLRGWGIDTAVGERPIEVFAALAAHAGSRTDRKGHRLGGRPFVGPWYRADREVQQLGAARGPDPDALRANGGASAAE